MASLSELQTEKWVESRFLQDRWQFTIVFASVIMFHAWQILNVAIEHIFVQK